MTSMIGSPASTSERTADDRHHDSSRNPAARPRPDDDAGRLQPENESGRRRWGRRASVLALLALTALLYLWDLAASGYANSFYAAAAQAGSQSWKAFLFGSLDASNAITVDKPPASLWLMALSIRLFGLSSWSLLVPQALCGVASVGVLYAAVRHSAGQLAGLAAGVMLALTPVAALMFRFDNPDALLVLLLTGATYLTLRGAEQARRGLLIIAGVLVGLAFLTKMLQAFLILPVFAVVYLLVAPTTLGRRIRHLLLAFAAMIVTLGWWVALVELVPASMRPYVGGSTNDSVLDLIFGYNGLARILGRSTGNGAGGGGGGTGFGGSTGITRLFDGVSGGMIGWLIPAAVVLAVVAVVLRGRAPRTDRARAAVLLWAGSMITTGLVFSFMAGTYHDYYTIALAPSIAATVAVAGTVLWRERATWLARIGLAAGSAITAGWAFALLSQPSGEPYATLRWLALVFGAAAALGLLMAHRLPKLLAGLALALAFTGAVTGPGAYTVQTVGTAHEGSIVTAGPSRTGFGSSNQGGFGGPGGFGGRGGFGGQGAPGGQAAGGQAPGGNGQIGGNGQTPATRTEGFPNRADGGMGEGRASSAVISLLRSDASYTWAAATTGSQSAATYQLATGLPVMAIGGFTGSDPSPTLAQFQADVAAKKIHYYIAGGGMGGSRNGQGTASQISSWVSENFTARTVGTVTVYDLTSRS